MTNGYNVSCFNYGSSSIDVTQPAGGDDIIPSLGSYDIELLPFYADGNGDGNGTITLNYSSTPNGFNSSGIGSWQEIIGTSLTEANSSFTRSPGDGSWFICAKSAFAYRH